MREHACSLFGEWQTVAWAPPPIAGGKITKNAYGNVELWSPEHLPAGAAHLTEPRIAAAARRLKIDFAPAMVGFEIKKGAGLTPPCSIGA